MPASALARVRVTPHYRARGQILELPMYAHLGKFEGEPRISEAVWDLSLEGGEGLGDAETFGYYSAVDLGPDAVDGIAAQAREIGFELTPAERGFIRGAAGAIVREDSAGFVYVDYFKAKADYDKAWADLETDYDSFMEDSEGPWGGGEDD